MQSKGNEQPYEWEITAERRWYRLGFKEVFGQRDLIVAFFRREVLAGYNHTALGLTWLVLQPLLTAFLYYIVFRNIVKVSTNGIPAFFFYFSGSIVWSFFSDCMTSIMYSFLSNSSILQKVYFPRLVLPAGITLNHLLRLGIQLGIFAVLYMLFVNAGFKWAYTPYLPVLLVTLLCYTTGVGLIMSVLVAKYRDVEQLMFFVLRLYLFLSPVVYPSGLVPANWQQVFWLNPLTPVMETLRVVFFGGEMRSGYMFTSLAFSVVIWLVGILIYKRHEIQVMDTI